MHHIQLQEVTHKSLNRIALRFEKNDQLISTLRAHFNDVQWSRTLNCWHIECTSETLGILLTAFKGIAFIDYRGLSFRPTVHAKKSQPALALNEEAMQKLEQFTKYMRSKRFAESTINTYVGSMRVFLNFHREKAISTIDNQDIVRFNNEYILAKRLSSSFQNQIVNAVKKFFLIVENRRMDIEAIHRPKKERKLPSVISKDEVKVILEAPRNIKHKVMLSLIYACGLRRSELINLKPLDVDSKRKLLIIRQSKGNKDRVVPLSEKIIDMLREYYKVYRPKEWLFEGQLKGSQYTASSLQNVLKQALNSANINKPVTLHWLRHSYATHLLENGTDLRFIQEILGHKSSRTTEIYTHVSTKSLQNIKSPFDDL